MVLSRTALALSFVVAAALAAVAPARAVDCGTLNPLTNEPVVAALTLNSDKSDSSLPFKWRTDNDQLQLFYKVSGCTVPEGAVPKVEVVSKGTPHIDEDAVGDPALTGPRAGELRIDIPIDPDKMDPGKYDLFVQITGDFFASENTPAEVSRFASMWYAVGAAILGALAALGYTLLTAAAKSNPTGVRVYWLLASIAVCLVTGIWVLKTDYFSDNIETWTVLSDGWKTLLDAFAAAATVAAGAIGLRVWRIKKKARAARRTPTPTPTPTPAKPPKQKKRAEGLAVMLARSDL